VVNLIKAQNTQACSTEVKPPDINIHLKKEEEEEEEEDRREKQAFSSWAPAGAGRAQGKGE
jgi:hypothetical protein